MQAETAKNDKKQILMKNIQDVEQLKNESKYLEFDEDLELQKIRE